MHRPLLFAFPAALLLLQIVAVQTADLDLWGRLSVGAVLFQSGHFPRIDDFSYTARGAPWVDHEWLSGVVFYGLLRAGEPALVLFKYAAALLALGLVFVLHASVYRACLVPTAWTLALLGPAIQLGFGTTVRAQVFSIALFLAFLLVLERVRLGRPGPRALLWLLPAGIVWGNLHGGFAMGLLAIGCYAGADACFRRFARAAVQLLVAAGILAGLAAANPYGPAYLGFLLHAWTLDRRGITEWQPLLRGFPALSFESGVAALAASVATALAVVGIAAAARERWLAQREGRLRCTIRAADRERLAPALILALVVVMTLLAARIAPFLALALAAYLPLFARREAGARRLELPAWLHRPLGTWLPAAAAAAACIGLVLQDRPFLRTIVPDETTRDAPRPLQYPVGAVEFLLASPHIGNLLNPFNKGQFLYWTLYPGLRVAVDGRYEEVYTQKQFREVYRFYRRREGEPPEAVVEDAERSGADFVLCPSRWRAKRVLDASARFDLVYDDGVFALLARTDATRASGPVESRRGRESRPPVTIAAVFAAGGHERFAAYPQPGSRGPRAAGERPAESRPKSTVID